MFENHVLLRRLFACCSVIAAVLLLGTFGYMAIEKWNVGDSFYMSVITLATVGYGETHPLSPLGRLFTTALIFISVAGLSMWTASLTSLLVEGEMSGTFRKRKAKKMAASLTNHTIVCGSGLMATAVLHELSQKNLPVVLVDDNAKNLESIRRRFPRIPVIEASAIDELALFDAGVLSAKNIVAALPDDFENLMIAMTCRDLGKAIKIVACSEDQRIANRMLKAGVDNVICPLQLCGQTAANWIMA